MNNVLKHNSTVYFYKNNITKKIFDNGDIWWFKNNERHREDGAQLENCFCCSNNLHSYLFGKYKRHFMLYNIFFSPKEFAEKTNHIICKICWDFCKQECFI